MSTAIVLAIKPHFVYLRRVRLDRHGYTIGRIGGGEYWGVGAPLYFFSTSCPITGDDVEGHFRAADRQDAKDRIRNMFPHGTVRP